jgi:hypothetical protein
MTPEQAERRKKDLFVQVFAETGNVTAATKAAGIGRTTHYRWLQADPAYKAEVDNAREEAVERLEREALRRAVEGVDEPVFHKGEVCGQIRRYSDTLLIFMLKAANPEKYRERFEHRANVSLDASVKVVKGDTWESA